MDTMTWAGQICQATIQQTVTVLVMGAWLMVGLSFGCWAMASMTRRIR